MTIATCTFGERELHDNPDAEQCDKPGVFYVEAACETKHTGYSSYSMSDTLSIACEDHVAAQVAAEWEEELDAVIVTRAPQR